MIYWIAFILFFNFVDYKVTHKGGKPNYTWYNIIKTIAAIGCSIPVVDFANWKTIVVSGLVMAIFEACSFWIIYELIRNLWSRRPLTWRELLYFDQKELDSGKLDLFFAKRGWKFHAWCKLAALITAFLSGGVILFVQL